jgi:DNA-binding transcriptional ArsR family regulator
MPNGLANPDVVGVFKALADPTRLAVVERLSIGPASVTELARPFEMALPSFMQHLTVLHEAGLVHSHKSGRTRVYQLALEALESAAAWLSANRNHWVRRLDQLDSLLFASTASPTTDR